MKKRWQRPAAAKGPHDPRALAMARMRRNGFPDRKIAKVMGVNVAVVEQMIGRAAA